MNPQAPSFSGPSVAQMRQDDAVLAEQLYPSAEKLMLATNQDMDGELRRLRGRADMLARAVKSLVAEQPAQAAGKWACCLVLHESARCIDAVTRSPIGLADWTAGGCEDLCKLCLLNRALAIYEGRA